ncbi:unnamed protein product [Protopolystoma xenopodis]|uniref:RRM domain-containing protein n=1 Tax=Protopolystoma xenopodis TaxID=117903 RepID=A0A3S5BMI9_9PLAT|nr:unnamed protein product [Protopolystoma xenopodis]
MESSKRKVSSIDLISPNHQRRLSLESGSQLGPDEVMISNGNGHVPMDLETNESKKSRMDNLDAPPSKVVHVRNMPSDASENEIALLGIPFGMIDNLVLSKKNNQALMEMATIDVAIALVSYYRQFPVNLHGKNLMIQFSKHQRLELHSENNVIENAVKNANRLVAQDLSGVNSGLPNTVLRILIDNIMGQQINHMILYKIFHRFGKILRVIIFLRNNQYQCLLEFEDPTQAFVAMLHLNGQNIYTGCCSLRVEFSKNRGPLEIRHESDKCRDYLISPLADEEISSLRSLPGGTGVGNVGIAGSGNMGNANAAGIHFAASGLSGNNMQCLSAAGMPGGGFQVSSGGGAPGVSVGLNDLTAQLTAFAQQSGVPLSPAAAAATASFMALAAQGGQVAQSGQGGQAHPALPGGLHGLPGVASSNAAAAAAANMASMLSQAAAAQSGGLTGVGLSGGGNSQLGLRTQQFQGVGSNVLIVSNLNDEASYFFRVYPDALFTLFGVYGDVTRVKIMFNKKDTSLVQFADAQQALCALKHLNGVTLWGKPMKISLSKYNVVQMPKDSNDAGLTKDYANSLLHRFRKPNSKNFQNIFAPSSVLHLSNIPASVTEDEIRALFSQKGYQVMSFRFMQKDKKMAFIQLESIDVAIQALIELHNTQLSENSHLRISFSRTTI